MVISSGQGGFILCNCRLSMVGKPWETFCSMPVILKLEKGSTGNQRALLPPSFQGLLVSKPLGCHSYDLACIPFLSFIECSIGTGRFYSLTLLSLLPSSCSCIQFQIWLWPLLKGVTGSDRERERNKPGHDPISTLNFTGVNALLQGREVGIETRFRKKKRWLPITPFILELGTMLVANAELRKLIGAWWPGNICTRK